MCGFVSKTAAKLLLQTAKLWQRAKKRLKIYTFNFLY